MNINQASEIEIRIYTACLEIVKKLEEDQNEKKKVETVIAKLSARRDKKVMQELTKPHYEIFTTLWEIFNAIRKSFDEMIKSEEYAPIFSMGFQILKYLPTIFPNVTLSRDKLDRDTIMAKYFVFLTTNFKKEVPGVQNKFITEWSKKAREKIREELERSASRRREEEIEQAQKKKTQPTIPTTLYQKQKPVQKQSSDEEGNSSEESDYNQKKNEQDRAKQNRESQQRARDTERQQRMQREDERKKEDERKYKQRNQKQADAREQIRLSRGRINVIEKYIESRRDLSFEKGKNKEVTEFLAAKLDQFLKNTMEQLYNIACLKNKKNPKFGNQLGYFAQENGRVENSNQFYFQPNTKIYSLSYKHKHQIYSSLRIKEVKKEDELRNALEVKTNEGEKKIEKRIENYILKPRPKQTQAFLTPYRDEKEYSRGQMNPAVSISLQHFVYFLQNHSWLKNSLLLFNVYHRF